MEFYSWGLDEYDFEDCQRLSGKFPMIFCGRYAGSSRSLGVRDDPFDLVSDLLNGSVIFLVVGGEGAVSRVFSSG